MPVRDDGGIGVVAGGFGKFMFGDLDDFLAHGAFLAIGHHHVIGRNTGLAGIEEFAPAD